MVATRSAGNVSGWPMPWWQLTLVVAALAVAGLGFLGAMTVLGGPQRSSSAGACNEVTGAACRPFVDEVYAELGSRGSEVSAMQGRPWCGEDTCQVLFGGEALRLRVTFYDGTTAEFSCWRPALGEPSCEPAR
jgi:hypothetical protein